MPYMSADDFSVHDDDCEKQGSDWMPLSDLPDEVTSIPDEVTSIDDLDCEYWSEYGSLSEI
jgi:hypothetical protein